MARRWSSSSEQRSFSESQADLVREWNEFKRIFWESVTPSLERFVGFLNRLLERVGRRGAA